MNKALVSMRLLEASTQPKEDRPLLPPSSVHRQGQNRMAEATARHRAHYLALVKEDPQDWQRIEAIYGQVKQAWRSVAGESVLEFVHELAMYQERQGLWQDRESWLNRALQLAKGGNSPAEVGGLLCCLGAVYRLQGR